MLQKPAIKKIAPFLLLGTSLMWGFSFIAQVEGSRAMGPMTFMAGRFILAALALLPLIFLFERKQKLPNELKLTLLYGCITGVIVFVAGNLQQAGITMTQEAGKAAFINGLYTVLVPIFGMVLGKKPTLFTALGAAFAMGGLYLLSVEGGFGSIETGDLLMMAGTIFWAMHIMSISAFSPKVQPLRLTFVQFAITGLLSAIGMFLFEQPEAAQFSAGLWPLLYGGLIASAAAYTLQMLFQRHVEAPKAAIIYSMESLWAAIGAFILLGEVMTPRGYLGGALMICAVILSQMRRNKPPAPSSGRSSPSREG
ncbi:MAG: DMT family transporter [Oscillospiraceae bacterium]|nr:DMT family transporter [Oscillospiraceae bacterium]